MNFEKLNPRSRLFQLGLSNPGAGGLPADVLRLIRKMVKSGYNPKFGPFGAPGFPDSQKSDMATPWKDGRELVIMISPGIWRRICPTLTIDERYYAGQFSISYMLSPGIFIDSSVYKHSFVAITGDFQGHVYVLTASSTHMYITKQFIASPDECAPRRLTAVAARKPHEQGECLYQIRACCYYMVLSAHAAGGTVVRVFRLPDTAAHRNVNVRLDDYELGKPIYFVGTRWKFSVDSFGYVVGEDAVGKIFVINMRTSRVTTTDSSGSRITMREDGSLPSRPYTALALWVCAFIAAIVAFLVFSKS